MTTPVPFTTHRDADINIDKTFMCGTIQATRAELQRAFGAPHLHGNERSISTSWKLGFADQDETVAAIYDWERYATPGENEVITWHIAGEYRQAVELVHQAFRAAMPAVVTPKAQQAEPAQ